MAGTATAVAFAGPAASAGAADATTPCVTAVAPTTILNTPKTGKRLVAGVAQTATLPTTVPADASAVVVQARVSGTKAGTIAVAPTAGSFVTYGRVLATHYTSSVALVDAPGGKLSVRFDSLKGATASAVVQLTGYVAASPCFTAQGPAAAVDTTSGVGLAGAGPLPAGSSTAVSLGGTDAVPATGGPRAVVIRVTTGATASTLTLDDDSAPSNTLLSWTVPANDAFVDTRILPPSATGSYMLGVTGGAVGVSITPLGWFADANAYAMASDLVLDTSVGVGIKKAPMYSGQKATLAIPADITSPAGLVVTLTEKSTGDATVDVYPSSSAKPIVQTASFRGGRAGYAQLLIPPGTSGKLVILLASGSAVNLQAVVSGWIPVPPPPNQPVAGVVTIPTADQVASVSPKDAAGNESVTYTGPDRLNQGDVVVMDATPDQPDGYLGVVTDVTQNTLASRTASRITPASVTPQATGESQSVDLRPGALTDAIPTADMDSGELATASDDPPPDDSPPLPPDTPPGQAPAAVRPATVRPAATSGGALPNKALFTCSAGVSAAVTASLKLSAGIDIGGSWSPWSGVSAQFGFNGSVSGSVALNVNASASCSTSPRLLDGPSLPTIRFFIGPVPVIVHPKLEMGVSVSGSVDGAFKASASANLNMSAGVKYQNGGFSPYFNEHHSFPVVVQAHAGASIKAEVKPRLELALYGIAGPFAEIGAYAKGDVNLGANPWWSASAGIVADVGFAIDVFGIHKSYDASERTLATFSAGSAGGPYPGATITTTGLPAGQTGSGYGYQLGATGGSPPYSWYLVSGSLPAGLALSKSGVIGGTPTTVQTTSFVVRAIDAAGNRTGSDQTLSLTINAPAPPPPCCSGGGGTVTVSWGSRAAASICGGDTSCTYVVISWSGFGTGNHTITPYFDGQGNWCGTACANSLVRSGSSGTLTNYWAAGYCGQSHSVSATVDGVGSNSISTTAHGC